MPRTKVVHCKKEDFDVYIGRPSMWGNPFVIGKHGDRDAVIDKYRKHLLNDPLLMSCIMDLDGKVLGCHCHPQACHGDVIAETIYKIRKGEITVTR